MMPFDKLRKWQQRFVAKFVAWQETIFLLVALPGGGKTVAGLYAANEWCKAAGLKQRFIVVVVPSRNLKRQWRKVAKKRLGLEFQTKEFSGDLKPDMHGCVVTYNQIASDALVFRRLCAKYEILAIFDEIHHAGESAAWGEGLREAFEGAAARLAMSGTPWRSDGGTIPFLPINPETGEYVLHERFDWPEALSEDPPVVRELAFKSYHGSAEYQNEKTNKIIHLDSRDDKLSDEDIARCLRGRIYERQFCVDMLREAHAKLLDLRELKYDAAGIVVCVDIDHAKKVADWLRESTGEIPVIAVSDDEVSPGEPIENFGADGALTKWIVSVRQISEGADIPRMIVGVYLTNYTTELFFRQFVGRIARNQGTEFDQEAHVYYPDHPILNKYAADILKLQAIAIAQRGTEECDDTEGGGRIPSSLTYMGGSGAEFAGLITPTFNEERLSPIEARTIAQFAKEYRIPETTARRIMRDRERNAFQPEPTSELFQDDRPLEERLEDKRRAQSKRVGYWARLTGRSYDHLNNEANEHVGCATVKVATEEQLDRRARYIEQRIKEARNAA